ncbi:MAG: relaxase/mobilization nuclease domain-containing protein [Cyanobacteria bacterium J06621_8]
MIGNITTGSYFGGLVNYLLDPTKAPQVIDTNLAGSDRNTLIWELNACAAQRPSCKKPVKHISIGLAPSDGEVDFQVIRDVACGIVNNLGYENNQYLVVRHGRIDPRHDRVHGHTHFHILINGVDVEGKRVRDSYDKRRLERILREKELEHNLTIVASSQQRSHKAPSNGQVQRIMKEVSDYEAGTRTERPRAPIMVKIQAGIDLASKGRPSLGLFLARLQKLDIDPKLRIELGQVTGISYRLQDFKVRGCKLHRSSFRQLVKHRVDYDPQRDDVTINLANLNQKIRLEDELEMGWEHSDLKKYLPVSVGKKIKQLSNRSAVTQQQLQGRRDIENNNKLELEY